MEDFEDNAKEAHYFDELAKGLAKGTLSRGRALKLLGAGLISSVLVPLIPGIAGAAVIRCSSTGCNFGCGGFVNCSCTKTTEGAKICVLASCSSSGKRCTSSND